MHECLEYHKGVDVKVGRFFEQKKETGSLGMQCRTAQMQYPQFLFFNTNLISWSQQWRYLCILRYRATELYVLDSRRAELLRQISRQRYIVDDIFGMSLGIWDAVLWLNADA